MGKARGRSIPEWGGVVRVDESDGAALAPCVQVFAEVHARSESQARKALAKLVSRVFGCSGRPEIVGLSRIAPDGRIVDQSLLDLQMDGWIDEKGEVVDMGGDLVQLPNIPPPHTTSRTTGQNIIPFTNGPRHAAPASTYVAQPSLAFPFPDEVIAQIGDSIKDYEVTHK